MNETSRIRRTTLCNQYHSIPRVSLPLRLAHSFSLSEGRLMHPRRQQKPQQQQQFVRGPTSQPRRLKDGGCEYIILRTCSNN